MTDLQSTVISQLSALFPIENKQAQIAMATVLLNYTIVSTSHKVNNDAQLTCLNISLLFLQGINTIILIYRVSVLEMDFFRRLEMIGKLNILTCIDDNYVAKGWPF